MSRKLISQTAIESNSDGESSHQDKKDRRQSSSKVPEVDRQRYSSPASESNASQNGFVIATESGISIRDEDDLLARNLFRSNLVSSATSSDENDEILRPPDLSAQTQRRATPYSLLVPAKLSLPQPALETLGEDDDPTELTSKANSKPKVLRFDTNIAHEEADKSVSKLRRDTPANYRLPMNRRFTKLQNIPETESKSATYRERRISEFQTTYRSPYALSDVDKQEQQLQRDLTEEKRREERIRLEKQETERERTNSAKVQEWLALKNSQNEAKYRRQRQNLQLELQEKKLREMQNETALSAWSKSVEERENAARKRLLSQQQYMHRVAEKKQLDRLERQNQLKLLRKNEHDAKLQRARQLRLAEQQREAQADQVIELWLKKRAEREVEAAYEQAMRTERAQLLQARLKREAEQREADRKKKADQERAERVKLRREKAETQRGKQKSDEIYKKWWAEKSKQIEYERQLEEERQKDLNEGKLSEEEKRERKEQSERIFRELCRKRQEEIDREHEIVDLYIQTERMTLQLKRDEQKWSKAFVDQHNR